MKFRSLAGLLSMSVLATSAMAKEPAAPALTPAQLFAATPAIDIAADHDFNDAQEIDDSAAAQLKGLCSLAEFRALPAEDRHVYSFDPWPGSSDALGQKWYTFNFHLGDMNRLKLAFIPEGGGPGGVRGLVRTADASGRHMLAGFGNLDWGGNLTHVFRFDKPVAAFGVVLNSADDIDLRRFFWPAAVELNGYPLSYQLADGTVVQLGTRELRGALIKGNTNAFIGVRDRSGTGIVSVTYTLKGLGGNKAQPLAMRDLAFVTMPQPATAAVISLKSSCDFGSPDALPAAAAVPGLASAADFRFIVGNHRYVYHFNTWPSEAMAADSAVFKFDTRGKGAADQTVTLRATNSTNQVKLAKATLTDSEAAPYPALGGLGDLNKGAWAQQTLQFEKPVYAAGITYRSASALSLGDGKAAAVSYTLSDGSVVDVSSAAPATLSANAKTFVGVIDKSDKGISSITFRVQGESAEANPLYIEDLAFAISGPPPGDWKLTLDDNFDGNTLNPKIWSTGYRFVDVINNELQGFVPENVVVADGLCTIKTEYRDCRNTDRNGKQGKEQKFASGAFTSVDKFTQTYGYFEARIKMPKARGAGVWPAFWLLPDRGPSVPDNVRYSYTTKENGRGVEVDIFEFMPRWKQLNGLFPVHVGCIWNYGKVTPTNPAPHGYGGYARDNDGWGPKELDFPNLDGEFHTYGLYWSPQRLIWYVDSKPVFRVKDAAHVPNVPHYFLFNVSVHGNGWGKSPDKTNPTMQDMIGDMPNQMQIDYFRAYSGTLDEAVPADDQDVAADAPPSRVAPPANSGASGTSVPATAPKEKAGTAPAAPVNSGIDTPSTG